MTRKLRILLGVVAVTVPVDQLAKMQVEARLLPGQRAPLIDGFLYVTHARNPGAAFGLFASAPEEVRTVLFVAVSILALVVIGAFFRRLAPGDRVQSFGLSLVLGGAAGNFIDRMWRGEVVDFLHLRLWGGYSWPDFNVADVCIIVGVGSLMVDLLAREASSRAAA